MIKHHTVTHVKIACLQHNKISQRCVTNKVKMGRRFLRHFDPHVPNCCTRHHISEGFHRGVLYSQRAKVTVGFSQFHCCLHLEGSWPRLTIIVVCLTPSLRELQQATGASLHISSNSSFKPTSLSATCKVYSCGNTSQTF